MVKSIFKLTVRGYELDSFGHVNNAVYLQYAEEAKWHFFSESITIEVLEKMGLFPIILENVTDIWIGITIVQKEFKHLKVIHLHRMRKRREPMFFIQSLLQQNQKHLQLHEDIPNRIY